MLQNNISKCRCPLIPVLGLNIFSTDIRPRAVWANHYGRAIYSIYCLPLFSISTQSNSGMFHCNPCREVHLQERLR